MNQIIAEAAKEKRKQGNMIETDKQADGGDLR